MLWYSLFGHMKNDQMNHMGQIVQMDQMDQMDQMNYGYEYGGGSPGHNFPDLAHKAMEAASEYVNRAEIETGAPALIASFRLVLIPFIQYILSVQGAAVRLYRNVIFPGLTEIKLGGDRGGDVYGILRSREVTAVYSVNTAIAPFWPYGEDTRATVFIQEASRQLGVKDEYGMYYTQKLESYLETVAKRGACAIAAAIETDPSGSSDQEIINLIFKFHAWKTALEFLENYHYSMMHAGKTMAANSMQGNGANGQASAANGRVPVTNGQQTEMSRRMIRR